jgi:hypothetical protein
MIGLSGIHAVADRGYCMCIFKISYESGTIPAIWKTANICPVFKKGNKFEAINYRPISLTCISCKLMEHIITRNPCCSG